VINHFPSASHKKRFGSWVVNNTDYTSKLSAVLDAVKTGHWIHWNFNDIIFGAHDWTQEPADSLATLYGARARTLREQYAHIAIEYSGGADSWNLLYHFCVQGLHVDTVIHRYAGQTVQSSKDKTSENQWAEGKFQAWPSFQKLLELNPTLNWKTWDVEDSIMSGWDQFKVDFSIHNNFHPGAIVKLPGVTEFNPFGIPNLSTSAVIYGVDKPRVELHDNKFYLVFYDHQVINRSVHERILTGVDIQDIFFYWDPNCLDLMSKQAHLIINWFRSHPDMIKHMKNPSMYNRIINPIIYPDYKLVWQSEKPSGLFAQSHENWFIKNQTLKGSDKWHKILQDYSDCLENSVGHTDYCNYIEREPNSFAPYKRLSNCPSNRYYLGDL
jgi:hypothetical protein